MRSGYVELSVKVKKATAKALMVECEDADVDEQWIPLSVCDLDAGDVEVEEGSMGTLCVAEWFATREGLT